MKIKFFNLLIILLFLIIFFIFYKGLQNTNIYTPSLDIKKEIPSFKTAIFSKNEIVDSDKFFENDKFYLINIWSSWCVPCKEEHPFLLNLSKEKKLEIIGINYKDKQENAKKFLNKLGSPYKLIFLDPEGILSIEWGAYGVPETFLVYDKMIIKKIIGPMNIDNLKEIKKIIQ